MKSALPLIYFKSFQNTFSIITLMEQTMKLFRKLFFAAGALGLLFSAPAGADERLEEIQVKARPIGLQSLEHISQPVTVIRDEALKARQSSTIGETLENIPGVTTNRFSPLASRPVIRGLAGSRVQVLENGLGALDVSTLSVDHAVSIDPLRAQQIEIFRGPATLLYGSEASGGLVNVVTNRILEYVPESFEAGAYYSFNSNSAEKVYALQAQGGLDKLSFSLDGLKRSANDYDAKGGRVINSFYDVKNFNLGTSFVDDWGFLGFAYSRFASIHGVPFNPDEPDEVPFIDAKQDRFDVAGRLNGPFGAIEAISFQGAYNDYGHTEFEEVGHPGTVFKNEQFEGRVEAQHAPLGAFMGVIGAQFGDRTVSAVGDEAFLPRTSTGTFALFVLEEADLAEALHFEIGGRYERQKSDPDGAAAVSKNMYSLSSGLKWDFSEALALGLNIGRSQRAPAAEELFSNGPHVATGTFEIGQRGLKVETANSIDLSLGQEEGALQWKVNLFANYIEDFIFLQGLDRNNDGMVDKVEEDGVKPGGEFLLVQYQQADAIFYGLEAAASFNLHASDHSRLDLNLFGDYVRAKRQNGPNLPRISPARIGAGLDYRQGRFMAGLDLTRALAQNDNGPLETPTKGYTQLNLRADYALLEGERNLKVFVKARNLLDEAGQLHTSFIKTRAPIMGRAFIVGFEAGF